MFLLDTNAISGLRRRDKADEGLRAWADAYSPSQFFLSVISILEIEIGTLLLARKNAAQADIYRKWLDSNVLVQFDGRILPIDTTVSRRCADLHVPDKKSERDAFIAATALVHDMTVVTRNTADFVRTGARLLNPWAG